MTREEVETKVADAYQRKVLDPYANDRKFARVDAEKPLYKWASGKQLFNAAKTNELLEAHHGPTAVLFSRLNLGLIQARQASLVAGLVLEGNGDDAQFVIVLIHRG